MTVLRGDCVEVMAGMEPDSVDALVTDPPYGLEFMGKEWDRFGRDTGPGYREKPRFTTDHMGKGFKQLPNHFQAGRPFQQWCETWAAAALRVAKPGAYLLAFGGTRTVHRMTCALEDAGWVVRDMLMWVYLQGFPKSKASLKPAYEPIVLCRKPGASRDLNIDASRLPLNGEADPSAKRYAYGFSDKAKAAFGSLGQEANPTGFSGEVRPSGDSSLGRWPANVVMTEDVFGGGVDGIVGGGWQSGGGNPRFRKGQRVSDGVTMGGGWSDYETGKEPTDTEGSKSRIFMIGRDGEASAGRRYDDRGSTDFAPLPGQRREPADTPSRIFIVGKAPTSERVLSDGRRSPHPTQKPEALIRHLVKLITPDGGVVLDPFLGSGTLGVVCDGLGMRWLGIERDETYASWAEDRIRDGSPRWLAEGSA